MAKTTIEVGQTAPDFTLPTQDGATVTLSSFRDKCPVVVYFYPKDDTPGCTVEACTFRDQYEDFREAGAEIIGISADSPDSHQRFASKHSLPFILASDEQGTVRKAYGVSKTLGLLPGRATFIIDKGGIVRHTFSSQLRAKQHVAEALETLKSLST
ncbi:MAG: peroxiredoxin [Pseudomonadota bacterium]|nr:peroxiredoxin [Pseudomonadota bacterium]